MQDYIDLDQIQKVYCKVEEKETDVIVSADSDTMEIYTNDSAMIHKLKKNMQDNPTEWKCRPADFKNGSPTGYLFYCPKRCLSIRSGIKRVVSEEESKALSERMKKTRKNNLLLK